MRYRNALLIAGIAGGIALSAAPALAQQQLCFERDEAIESLKSQYGEEVVAQGLTADGKALLELLTGENGSWTLIMTRTDGVSCMVTSGEQWTDLPTGKEPAV